MICGTVSTVGGLIKGIDQCIKLGFDGTQAYTTASRRWNSPLLSEKKSEEIRAYAEDKKILLMSHVPFLVNLATADISFLYNRSIERLKAEVISCGYLGIRELVLHPGSSVDGDEERAHQQIIKGLVEVLPLCEEWDVFLMLETMSGMGTQCGATIDSIYELITESIDQSGIKNHLGICIDTAHIYAAGIEFDTYVKSIPNEWIGCFHLNNTKIPFGGKTDRHSSIFDGNIPLEEFESIVKRFPKIPHVLEFTQSDHTGEEQVRHLKGVLGC